MPAFWTLITIKVYCIWSSLFFHLSAPLSGMICPVCALKDSICYLYFSLLCLFKFSSPCTFPHSTMNHKTCIGEVRGPLSPPHINCSLTTLLTPQDLFICYFLDKWFIHIWWCLLNALDQMVEKYDYHWNYFCNLHHLSHSTRICWSLVKLFVVMTSPAN